jgi:hypothetical protein
VDDIKTDLKEMEPDSMAPVKPLRMGLCGESFRHDNELSSSVTGEEFFYQVSEYQLLKKGCLPYSRSSRILKLLDVQIELII